MRLLLIEDDLQAAEYLAKGLRESGYSVEEFVGIINPPEVALLAVGAIREEPVVKDGQVTAGLRMRMTLSADHRIIDGAIAAQFLQSVTRLLREPLRLI